MILAGDVGGTKVHLALFDFTDGNLKHARDKIFPAKEYAGLEEIVKEFVLAEKVTAACFGVPGPVREGRLRLTNLPWTLDSRELARNLKIDYVFLINDLQANGYGIAELEADQIYTLSEGDARQVGNRALISAGTGLGEAFLIWDGRDYVPYPSEGGHSDFAPRSEEEIDLLRFLRQKYNGRISFERAVSGQGLTNIYEFLRDARGLEEPAWLAERMRTDDPNAVITESAMKAKSQLCEKTLDMFVSAYGAEAGNLALKILSVGGLYVGGGIAPRILDKLKDGTFMKAFTDKGRMAQLLVNIPVRVILESRTALIGAAAYAEARAAELSGISPRAASVKF
ncbi:Glucokinase [Candidatus Sulfotelmatomonas gaucii]|uniref:Glucokinase n=1 Tax=Candidatus Sulfuritelmatomonas gaucii TaxID=2043161 RepID=A0A2N9L5I2_9BACT|nr:Glucokinase [Candidatus Sulfotelmatomonas gaucii]